MVLTGANADFTSWTGTNTVYGGPPGGIASAAGTLYRKTQAGVDSLIIDNNGVATYGQISTLMPNGVNLNSFSNVVLNRKGLLGVKGDTILDFNTFNLVTNGPSQSYLAIDSDTNVTYPANWLIDGYTLYVNTLIPNKPANVTIGTDGVLSHYKNAAAEAYKINLSITGNLTVLSNGTITADALGYSAGNGPGFGAPTYGGAHGGSGSGSGVTVNPKSYGSIIAPTNLGSGGGGGGGSGGGTILLTVAGTTTVVSAGAISANGAGSSGNGGGAGGSLSLTTGWLTGNGTLRANGGYGPNSGFGGGGGGRVAVVLTGAGADFNPWTGTNTAYGAGAPGVPAAAGTVYRQPAGTSVGAGTVTVSNNVSATALTGVPASLNMGETLRGSLWLVTGYGKLGVTTNVQLGYLTVTGANARVDLQGKALSVLPDLNLNGTRYGVGTYTTSELGAAITDSVGGGTIEVRPAVDNAGGATNVTQTSAGLNGNLYAADSSSALFVLWGAQDAGTNVAQWAHTNVWPAPVTAGYFSATVTAPDLLANTVQYYRFYTTNNAAQNLAATSSVFMTSDVTVQTTADASEAGLAPGTFTFYRNPAATNGAITVAYGIGGSARPGTNYVNTLGASITFAQGVSQTNLTFTPLQDDASQSNETIILTLASGPYPLGTPSVATGIVANSGIPGAPTNTWIGSGNANQATNWSLGHPPSNTEYVLLSGFSKASLTWNVTNAVMAWQQTDQYTGVVTFATVFGTNGFTNFTVSGDVTLGGGTWTHLANTTAEANRLRVTVGGNLFVSNATISADVLGYGNAQGPGSGSAAIGGAYGGVAPGAVPVINAKTYGSIAAPTNLGSGGGSSGGGAIWLTVGGTTTVTSAGMITANGQSSTCAGSGGSIYLTTGWLTGNGTLRANGGTGANEAWGSGSGGRVAIILTGAGADFTLWTGTNTTYGGATGGWSPAAAGTVYRRTQAGVDTLIIDNNDISTYGQFSTLMPNAVNLNSFSNVVLSHRGTLGVKGDTLLDFNTLNLTTYGPANSAIAIESDTNVTYPSGWVIDGYTLYVNTITTNKLIDVTIGTNGVLSHYKDYAAGAYKVNLTIAGNLTILSNGTITADTLGYGRSQGPGAVASVALCGGAYGGAALGGGGTTLNPTTYGAIFAPTNLGSGGGGSSGGGAIVLVVAGTTTVASAGSISANGGSSAGNGGGAGGSLYLTTGWLTGSGALRANGGYGASGNTSGGGSGGRVAIILTSGDFSSWSGTHTAYGALAGAAAAAGTVYRQTAGIPAGAGTVIADNGSTATNATFTSLPAFTNSTEVINKTVWVTTNRARIGLVTNATVDSLSLALNGALELANRTLTIKSLTVTNKVYRDGAYGPHDTAISFLTDTGSSGKVVVESFRGTSFMFR
jgi:hypothetical protein